MSSLADRVAVVTGAAGGIGRATAIELAERGARVVVSDIAESVADTAREIVGRGGEAGFVVGDIGDAATAEELVGRALEQFGRVDIAVNNAGTVARGSVAEIDPSEFERVIRTNLLGVFSCMHHELPPMIEAGSGVIVNLASIWGLAGVAGSAAYAASKHAIIGLTKSAALDHAKQGIRINALAPGPTDTAMTSGAPRERLQGITSRVALGRMGRPEEIARAIGFLCSDDASFVTGAVLLADGGWLAS